MTLAEKQHQLLSALRAVKDPQQRLAWLIEQARARPLLPVELRTEANLVPGCLARLWLVPAFREGRCQFQSESDSLIVKAVAGLLCDFYSGASPTEILAQPEDLLRAAGITEHLSPNRRNGLGRVVGMIRAFAASHAAVAECAHPQAQQGGAR